MFCLVLKKIRNPRKFIQVRQEKEIVLINKRGLHARASAKFVRLASQFNANIYVTRDSETVLASSIMELLMLAASKGTHLIISAEGKEANEALIALENLIKHKFGEEE